MDSQMTTRAALGRMASVGDLYDARRDNFCGLSIFKWAIPSGSLTLLDSHSSDIHLMHSDSFSEKFSKMDISAELSVSVLAGLFKLEGSGRYLSDKKKSSRTAKSSLIYKIQTNDESLNIYHEDLKDTFSLDAIGNQNATHVVTGISWGANSVVSCLYEMKDSRDEMKIEGSLSAQLNKVKLSISGKVQVTFDEGEKDNEIKFDVRIFGDILPKNGELPTTLEGALQLMKQLPSLVADCNNGKGKPLTYRLIPIQLIQKYISMENRIDFTLETLENASLVQVVQVFDQMTRAQQLLEAFFQDVNEHKYCVRNEDMAEISRLKNQVDIEEARLRSTLSSFLRQVRSGKKSATELDVLIQEFGSSPLSPQNVRITLQGWKSIKEKMSMATTLLESGATYIGLNSSLDEELVRNYDSKLFVLYFDGKSKSVDAPRLISNLQIFAKEIKKNSKDCRYYAVDGDFHPEQFQKGNSSRVQVHEGGKCITEDLLEEQNANEAKAEDMALKWVRVSNKILPKMALKCGFDHGNHPIYVARAHHAGSLTPGKLVVNKDTGSIRGFTLPWGGGEHGKNEFEILLAPENSVRWVPSPGNSIPSNAIPGGFSERGATLYIGRVNHNGTVTAGKIHGTTCLISYGNREHGFHGQGRYEILVRNE